LSVMSAPSRAGLIVLVGEVTNIDVLPSIPGIKDVVVSEIMCFGVLQF